MNISLYIIWGYYCCILGLLKGAMLGYNLVLFRLYFQLFFDPNAPSCFLVEILILTFSWLGEVFLSTFEWDKGVFGPEKIKKLFKL